MANQQIFFHDLLHNGLVWITAGPSSIHLSISCSPFTRDDEWSSCYQVMSYLLAQAALSCHAGRLCTSQFLWRRHTCISFHCQLNVLSVQQLSTPQIIQKKKKNVFEKKFCHFFASSFDFFFSLLIRLYQRWWQFVWVVVAIIQENGDLMASKNESETPYSWSTRQRMRSNAFSKSTKRMYTVQVHPC